MMSRLRSTTESYCIHTMRNCINDVGWISNRISLTAYAVTDQDGARRKKMKTWEELTGLERTPFEEKAEDILSGHWTCSRVWSAWSRGTMGRDDFHPTAEDDDIVADTASMLYDFVAKCYEDRAIIQQQLQPDKSYRPCRLSKC